MEVILKLLHYLSIFAAGGIGVGGAVIQSIYTKANKIPEPHLGKSFRVLGIIGLISIITLWISGLALVNLIYGSFSIHWAFHMKLFGALIVLAASAFGNFHLYTSANNQTAPNPVLMKRIASIGRIGLIVALLGAAIAFN